nr:hypothetical protein [Tanacetum cinerariifolium]
MAARRGDRIQVYIKKDRMFLFEPLLQDGICYVISNFRVTENVENCHYCHMLRKYLYKNTNVTRVDQINDNLIGFRNELFTYVIGTTVGIGDVVAVNSICSRKIRMTIVIEDKEQETEYVIYATVHSIQYESGGSAQICIFDGNMSGYTAWELVEKHGADTATYFLDELNCIIGKKFLFRVKFSEYNHKNNNHVYRCERVTNDEEIITYWKQESEEDSEDELTIPAVPIKTTMVLDLSLTRMLQLTSPSTCDIGSSSGQSLGSGKKRSRIIEHSIVAIDLSDSEHDTEDDDKLPNSKKPFVTVDEEPASQKEIMHVKVEKNLDNDVEKDLDKDVENEVENNEEPK